MKITFLGTGTSHGIPTIGCNCKVCTSTNPKNIRYRTCVHVNTENTSVIIDMPPEFRLRAIEYKVHQLDAVLFTHAHSDHCSGLDDIRPYNQKQKGAIPVYGNSYTLQDLKRRFFYIFEETQQGGGKPGIELKEIIAKQSFTVGDIEFLPLEVLHGELAINAFRIKDFAFITDVSYIPEENFAELQGLSVLVLDALRYKEHSTHFNLEQAIEAATKISAKQTFFTHISHSLEHEETNSLLPLGMQLAYDGLALSI
jgi:phosphoribosyl 1,2-cyclic phosphate phosphodiesterase